MSPCHVAVPSRIFVGMNPIDWRRATGKFHQATTKLERGGTSPWPGAESMAATSRSSAYSKSKETFTRASNRMSPAW